MQEMGHLLTTTDPSAIIEILSYKTIRVHDYHLIIKQSMRMNDVELTSQLLHNKQYNDRINYNHILCHAIRLGRVKQVEIIIKVGADPSFLNNWPVQLASEIGHYDIVELLLQYNELEPVATDNYAIRHALCNNHYDLVKLLLHDSRTDPFVGNVIQRILQLGRDDLNLALMLNDTVNPFRQSLCYFIWTNAQIKFVVPDILRHMISLVLHHTWIRINC